MYILLRKAEEEKKCMCSGKLVEIYGTTNCNFIVRVKLTAST
jgi:hypothetical protein